MATDRPLRVEVEVEDAAEVADLLRQHVYLNGSLAPMRLTAEATGRSALELAFAAEVLRVIGDAHDAEKALRWANQYEWRHITAALSALRAWDAAHPKGGNDNA